MLIGTSVLDAISGKTNASLKEKKENSEISNLSHTVFLNMLLSISEFAILLH